MAEGGWHDYEALLGAWEDHGCRFAMNIFILNDIQKIRLHDVLACMGAWRMEDGV